MHLIFDLDGTLIDSLPGIASALNLALESRRLPSHSVNRVRSFIGKGSLELVRQAMPDGLPDSLAHQLEAGFRLEYAEQWKLGTILYAGIEGMVQDLHREGHQLAVLSNKPDAFTREMVTHFFPEGAFGSVLGQSEQFPRKPAPDSALHLVTEWGIQPSQARFIGDSDVDRQTALNAGIPFVGVDWGYHPPENLGDKVASSVEELVRLL